MVVKKKLSAEPKMVSPEPKTVSQPAAAVENPERGYSDPLSGETRAERRSLLVTDAVLMAFVWGSLVPTKIAALGLELAPSERYSLLIILFAVNFYYFVAFLLYARVDDRVWMMAYAEAEVKMWEAFSKPDPSAHGYEIGADNPKEARFDPDIFFSAWKISQRVYRNRRWFDLRFPIFLTILVWGACLAKLVGRGI